MDVREFAVPFMTGGGDCPPCSDVALTADGRFAKISPNLHEGGGGGASLKTQIGFYHNHSYTGAGSSEIGPPVLGSVHFIVGGSYNNGLTCGLATTSANNTLDNANDNIGARLAYPLESAEINNIPLGTNLAVRQKITEEHDLPFGRRVHVCTLPKNGLEVDRLSLGVCR